MNFTLPETTNTANRNCMFNITQAPWVYNKDNSRWWTRAAWLLGIALVAVYLWGAP